MSGENIWAGPRQACSSHHQIVIWICFRFSICQAQPKYQQILRWHCRLPAHVEKLPFGQHCNFYRTQVNLGSDLWVRMSVTPTPCWNLTELTLADEDTKSILTDKANRAIQGNVTMQVMQSSGQVWKQCKWRHLMTKFWTNPSCAVWWPNMQLIHVVPSGGQICN